MRWQLLPQSGDLPGPRSSHCMAAVATSPGQTTLYLFGGELEPRVPLPALLYKYDMPAGAWSVVHTKRGSVCPGPRVGATLAAHGTKLYLFGGRTGQEMTGALCDLHMLDTAAAEPEWLPVPVRGAAGGGGGEQLQPSPPPRSFHSMGAAGNQLFVFGGCGASGRRNDLWAFDTATATWTELSADGDAAAPCPRGGPVLVAVPPAREDDGGLRLCVLGGFNGAELADCWVFDVTRHCWNATTPEDDNGGAAPDAARMPLARSVFGAAVHGAHSGWSCGHEGHVVVFGGEVAPSDKGHAGAGNFTAALSCLGLAADGARGGWHELHGGSSCCAAQSGVATPRGWFAATAVPALSGGVLAVHGGLGADNQRLNDLWLLTCGTVT